ncbi:beta-scruin [Trichonephila inaurata madagascariensis]|uniref:Beta-scruin n=1 Tax=Trichonephila inaurata madagascariensis TaxID=2747483 RepID=A0A8X7CFW1_9ARAC|nr:beta-scruin [Trichonephila inaurata madagascariensis]
MELHATTPDPEFLESNNVIFNYDLKSKKWSVLTKCPAPRHDSRMIATNRALYVIGGCNPLDHKSSEKLIPLKECYKYLFENKEWKLMAPLNHARTCHAAVIFKDMILAIGGKGESDRLLSSIERYDALHNSWEEFPTSLPGPRMAMGATAGENNIWVAGGIIKTKRLCVVVDSVWCYDHDYKCWLKRCKLPQPLAFCTLLTDKKQIICLGGVTRAQVGEDYSLESVNSVYTMEDSKEGSWTEDVPMPLGCHNVVAINIDGNIYVFGGFRTQTMEQMINTVYFDKKNNAWKPLCELPKRAAGFVVAVSGN